VSHPPYDSCNAADHVGDDPASVAQNRRRIAAAAGLPDPSEWVWLEQVHGAEVVDAGAATLGDIARGDAAATVERGLPLAVMSADCAPVVLASDIALGVVHAGHRGLAAGIFEAAVGRLRDLGAEEIRAYLGPCIRAECYEFGAHDLAHLVAQFGPEVEARTRDDRPAFDLAAGVRVALARAGVDALDDCGTCTAHASNCFSYRRDGRTGRQVTVAVMS
jgi:YfiH family protein